jgi:ATP diphosphatase
LDEKGQSVMTLDELLRIMAMLRDEKYGCPWDRKQTFQTIVPHTLEEVYEVADTIEREDYAHLANELGDLLFQIVFYAQLGKEAGHFDFHDVVNEIATKLLTRHPHVFPAGTMDSFGSRGDITSEQVEGNWEAIKQTERAEKSKRPGSLLDDIPVAFPSLMRARKIQKRAATTGFDWPDATGVMAKIREELGELDEAMASGDIAHMEEELGDLFFSLVNLSRHLKIDAESSLRKANSKFEKRFRKLEQQVSADGKAIEALLLEDMEAYWQAIKVEE